MNTSKTLVSLSLAALVTAVTGPAHAATIHMSYDFHGLNLDLPDGDLSGLVNRQTLTGPVGATVQSLQVSLQLEGTGLDGAWNGDFYATLKHDTGFAVLLNRVGRGFFTGSLGYSDNGLNVTFDDSKPDIHLYRNLSNPAGGTLTGVWGPDGRTADPFAVSSLSPRSAFLSSFHNTPLAGDWSLFLMDAESGATSRLAGWGLNFVLDVPELPDDPPTPTPVPDTSSTVLFTGLSLVALGFLGRPNVSRIL